MAALFESDTEFKNYKLRYAEVLPVLRLRYATLGKLHETLRTLLTMRFY